MHSGAGRVHLRRGDGAAGLAGGLPGPAPAAPAVPGHARPVRQPDGGQQRRHHRQRAVHRARRRGLVEDHGHREVVRADDLLAVRPDRQPGPVRVLAWASRCASCIELAGGMQPGHELRFWTPGGSSTPLLTAEHLDVPLDFEGVAAAGSILGTTATQIFSDQDCPVYATYRWLEFYHHESCGKCTPCREGNYWMVRIYRRILVRPGHPRGPGHPAGHLRQHPRPLVLRAGRRRDQLGDLVAEVLQAGLPRLHRGPDRAAEAVASKQPW